MKKLKIVQVGEIKEGVAESGKEYKYFPVIFSAGFGLKKLGRNMFCNDKGEWDRGTREEAIQAMHDKVIIDGQKVTRNVEPYTIIGESGEERILTTHSTIVFDDESVETVFRNNGRPLVEEGKAAAPVVVATGTPEVETADMDETASTAAPAIK